MITKEERENLTMLKADIKELVSGGTSEQTAKIVAGRNYIEYLHDTIDDMEAEIERLKGDKKAIGSKLYDSKQIIKKQSKEKKRLVERLKEKTTCESCGKPRGRGLCTGYCDNDE